jgi:anaphase-promoting complex subunit 5
MSRYLTPSKIGVLALVVLCTDATIPSGAIIPILSFITSQVIPQSTSHCDTHLPARTPSLALSIADFEAVTKGLESIVNGRSLYDKLLERLWSIDGLHALHEFMRDLTGILQNIGSPQHIEGESPAKGKILLSRTSPLGIFVRRAQLEFTRLQFDDTVKLWVAFMKFRAPSEVSWRKKNPAAAVASFDSNLAELGLEPDAELVDVVYPGLFMNGENHLELSTDDMERLLDFQLEKLQSRSRPRFEKGLLADRCRVWKSRP